MGYKKIWQPSTIPLQNDLSAWKGVFNDLHANLISAGLVQTATAGQLVINDVASLPARDTYAGFIEYSLNDALQAEAPVVLKLEFGCGEEGLDYNVSTSRRITAAPRIRSTVFFKGSPSNTFGCPQIYSTTLDGESYQNTLYGTSYICNNAARGFFGVVYGAGSRGSWGGSPPNPAYRAATFSVFLQRSLSAEGAPTGDGLAIYLNGLDVAAGVSVTGGTWTGANLPAAYSQYLPGHSNSISRGYAVRINAPASVKSANGELLFEPIYYSAPALKQFPYIYSYNYEALADGSQLALDVGPGQLLNFIALGRETSMSIDGYDAQRAGLIMLFDED